MITEETGRRIAVALERLIGIMERLEKQPWPQPIGTSIANGPIETSVVHLGAFRGQRGVSRPDDDSEGR